MDEDLILKALAHPARRQMLAWMRKPEQHFPDQALPHDLGICAGQFARCGLAQSSVSAHLAVLTAAGLIVRERIGQWVFYRRDEAVIAAFRNAMAAL
ncbi:helix-turn-helix transcriptional regulator [Paracoccus sp. IB05]|uniref:ArsR/SmtB family transcription factor n=1 Tax=Paracoccus sp. IB05 TaxID=2779367 RepID=UPI0018E78EC2|nr:metalloregulator ArsR/SmtB family transcription factor [Paracoccus sp. IB05]MBJ2151615.1 helix-turn-helix transcriptional regulator [Paracoccus sp. IB05]